MFALKHLKYRKITLNPDPLAKKLSWNATRNIFVSNFKGGGVAIRVVVDEVGGEKNVFR